MKWRGWRWENREGVDIQVKEISEYATISNQKMIITMKLNRILNYLRIYRFI